MTAELEQSLDRLKAMLLEMASRAEQAADRAVKALLKRDDDLALQVRGDDAVVDRLQMDIDELALRILAGAPEVPQLRLVLAAMKIAGELERVADEATTIARRVGELNKEPPLPHCADIPPLAALALPMLKAALDAFVRPDPAGARQVIERDKEVDRRHQQLRDSLVRHMSARPESINSCLHLMVIAKSLERMADHATNVAEANLYLHEGRFLQHSGNRLAP